LKKKLSENNANMSVKPNAKNVSDISNMENYAIAFVALNLFPVFQHSNNNHS